MIFFIRQGKQRHFVDICVTEARAIDSLQLVPCHLLLYTVQNTAHWLTIQPKWYQQKLSYHFLLHFSIGLDSYDHQRRKCERCLPNSLPPISYFGSIWELYVLDLITKVFCRKKNPATFIHGQGTHSTKIGLIVWPEIP